MDSLRLMFLGFATALGASGCSGLGHCENVMDSELSTPYREALVSPYVPSDGMANPYEAIAARADKGLTGQDTLWLIRELSSDVADRSTYAVIALRQSNSSAAASALLLMAQASGDMLTSALCYQTIGRIKNPRVIGLLATDYQVYGYRTPWARAVGQQLGVVFPKPLRFAGRTDEVYEWWKREGKVKFFQLCPELEKLGYPDGPFIYVSSNRPAPESVQAQGVPSPRRRTLKGFVELGGPGPTEKPDER